MTTDMWAASVQSHFSTWTGSLSSRPSPGCNIQADVAVLNSKHSKPRLDPDSVTTHCCSMFGFHYMAVLQMSEGSNRTQSFPVDTDSL